VLPSPSCGRVPPSSRTPHLWKQRTIHPHQSVITCHTNKCSKQFDTKAASVLNVDGSIAFARCRQCAPHLMHASLGPPKSIYQTAPRLVQPFLHSSRQTIPILYNGLPLAPPSKLTMHGVSGPHLIPGYLGPPKSITQTAPWSVQPLSWQTYRLTHWPTDRPRYCICNNRLLIYVRSSMMQSKNWHIQQRWWRELV